MWVSVWDSNQCQVGGDRVVLCATSEPASQRASLDSRFLDPCVRYFSLVHQGENSIKDFLIFVSGWCHLDGGLKRSRSSTSVGLLSCYLLTPISLSLSLFLCVCVSLFFFFLFLFLVAKEPFFFLFIIILLLWCPLLFGCFNNKSTMRASCCF